MRCERGATPALAGGAREAACSVHGSDFDTFGQSAACGLARRVGFNRLPRTEAGFQSADSGMKNGLGWNGMSGDNSARSGYGSCFGHKQGFPISKVWHNWDMSKILIRQMAQVITRQFKPERVILFGSQARGTGTKYSDVDFLVVLSSVTNKREAAIQIRRALAKFPVAKDIIVTTPDEIKQRGNLAGSVLRSALQEGKIIYERG